MGRLEKSVLVGLLVGLASCLLTVVYLDWQSSLDGGASGLGITVGVIGALMGMGAGFLVLRDLYLRDFGDPNAKMLWTLAILMTAGIGLFVYILVHALRPRPVPPDRPACKC